MRSIARGLDDLCINTIRFLAADAVQKADSGHPGMPMGAAAMAYVLWTRHLKHNPDNPKWFDRDRFILSAGHGSMLLYALLHLTGYDLPLSELTSFRQWDSRTPGHPEAHLTPGVEATTGPLGQGISTAVGMALAEAHLAAWFNRPDHTIIDHHTYVIASDGDLMEGVSSEACSLAGHWKLGKLIVLYDDNHISLAASTELTFTEDVAQRYRAYGWQVQTVPDGNDVEAIDAALEGARREPSRPSLILVRTTIGYGAPHKQNTFGVHGSPLGTEELAAAKKALGWPLKPEFHIPEEALQHFRLAQEKGARLEVEWTRKLARYAQCCPEPAEELRRRIDGDLPEGWDEDLTEFDADETGLATRKASEAVLQALAPRLPELMGGSADLNPSTYTWLKGEGDCQPADHKPADPQGAVGGEWSHAGRNVHFGVREHAMGAVASGMALHGGIRPYSATFLIFSDYMRPPMRLAALTGIPVIYVFTHDSIGLGEDGPTHQPVEQLMNLRAVPNLTVIRPADANETVQAWRAALLRRDGPTALVFSRQSLPVLDRTELAPAEELHRGGYILWPPEDVSPDIILIATGSEVHLALEAAKRLAADGINARVVSMPSWELFDSQPKEYRCRVLPPEITARVAVEAGARLGWEHYVGTSGAIVGLDRFGASAPGSTVYEKLGFTAEAVASRVKELLR
jgi:transketolase